MLYSLEAERKKLLELHTFVFIIIKSKYNEEEEKKTRNQIKLPAHACSIVSFGGSSSSSICS